MGKNWMRRSFLTYAFSEAFHGLFPMRGDVDTEFRIERIIRLSTGAVKALVSEATFELLWGASGAPFSATLFGEWTVYRGAPLLGQ